MMKDNHGYSGMTKPLARALRDQAAAQGATGAKDPTSPAALGSIQHRASSPKWSAYQVAIPAGLKALSPVLYPVPDTPDEPERPDMPAALLQGWRRFQAGLLLCRQEADGRAALQEFQSGVLLEAAFLDQAGRYLQASRVRPAYGVIPLAVPNSMSSGLSRSAECLVLLPCLDSPHRPSTTIAPMRMFVDGCEVFFQQSEEAE